MKRVQNSTQNQLTIKAINMSKITNPWDLAWSKWWIQQNYKKCEVDEMTLCEINELLEQD